MSGDDTMSHDHTAQPDLTANNAWRRVYIENLAPTIDGGHFPIKRVLGDEVHASCDLVADSPDIVTGVLLVQPPGSELWERVPLVPLGNDTFGANFAVHSLGTWRFSVEAWVDTFATWQRDLQRRVEARQHNEVDFQVGVALIDDALLRASSRHQQQLQFSHEILTNAQLSEAARLTEASSSVLGALMAHFSPVTARTRCEVPASVLVERNLAGFSAWYEFFPRSTGNPQQHGTLRDAAVRLEYVQAMGFDVVYLPPIHPIGSAFRKGKNNALIAEPDDVGSPWAIGSAAGGHKSIHPELGTLEDFQYFCARAHSLGLEVALDIALQASPDHPYVKQHPEWFRRRPDGSIQYAENPPKKYQDIYPFYFECEDRQALWLELKSIFEFWIAQGIRIFRVDNPHTKSARFWQWCLAELRQRWPELIFLAEAFTRPKPMHLLAKLGFSQSYTYFTWRVSASELKEYMRQLTSPPVSEFFRPNFWPNTPDILPEHLQYAGRPAFAVRLTLAATLCSNYGIYGPAFELLENQPRPGAEEYVDNEKYQLKSWDLDQPKTLKPLIVLLNQARRDNPCLQSNKNLRFHATDNELLLCYSKHTDDRRNIVLTIVNLDVHYVQSGWVEVNLREFGLDDRHTHQHDLLTDERFHWASTRNFVRLDPAQAPAHVFVIRRQVRSEHDFEYYL